jgi:hypothetical protein
VKNSTVPLHVLGWSTGLKNNTPVYSQQFIESNCTSWQSEVQRKTIAKMLSFTGSCGYSEIYAKTEHEDLRIQSLFSSVIVGPLFLKNKLYKPSKKAVVLFFYLRNAKSEKKRTNKGTLMLCPPTNQPHDILAHMKRPLNIPTTVTIYYCDTSTPCHFNTATLRPPLNTSR